RRALPLIASHFGVDFLSPGIYTTRDVSSGGKTLRAKEFCYAHAPRAVVTINEQLAVRRKRAYIFGDLPHRNMARLFYVADGHLIGLTHIDQEHFLRIGFE